MHLLAVAKKQTYTCVYYVSMHKHMLLFVLIPSMHTVIFIWSISRTRKNMHAYANISVHTKWHVYIYAFRDFNVFKKKKWLYYSCWWQGCICRCTLHGHYRTHAHVFVFVSGALYILYPGLYVAGGIFFLLTVFSLRRDKRRLDFTRMTDSVNTISNGNW